jgi:hypothetical protein
MYPICILTHGGPSWICKLRKVVAYDYAGVAEAQRCQLSRLRNRCAHHLSVKVAPQAHSISLSPGGEGWGEGWTPRFCDTSLSSSAGAAGCMVVRWVPLRSPWHAPRGTQLRYNSSDVTVSPPRRSPRGLVVQGPESRIGRVDQPLPGRTCRTRTCPTSADISFHRKRVVELC